MKKQVNPRLINPYLPLKAGEAFVIVSILESDRSVNEYEGIVSRESANSIWLKLQSAIHERLSNAITIHSLGVIVHCPKCDHEIGGWVGDPRGLTDAICEECGCVFNIPETTQIKIF